MTKEELLEKVDKVLDDAEYAKACDGWDSIAPIKALRAVIELHSPWTSPTGTWCQHCEDVFDASERYPCPTIKAIEREFNG